MDRTRHIAGGAAMIDWFDDLKVGTWYRGTEAEVSRDDIKRLAAEFDPQPLCSERLSSPSFKKVQQIGIDRRRLRGWHPVRETLVGFQRPIFQQLLRQLDRI